MQRTVIDCDNCGNECRPDEGISISIPNGIDRESGGHTVEIYFNFDVF